MTRSKAVGAMPVARSMRWRATVSIVDHRADRPDPSISSISIHHEPAPPARAHVKDGQLRSVRDDVQT